MSYAGCIDPSLLAEGSDSFDFGVYAGLLGPIVDSPLPIISGDAAFPFDSELRIAPPTISQLEDPLFDMGPYIESLVREEGESVDNECRTRAILRSLELVRNEGSSEFDQNVAWDGALIDYEVAEALTYLASSAGPSDVSVETAPTPFDLLSLGFPDPSQSMPRAARCNRCTRARGRPVVCCSAPGALTCDYCVFHKKPCIPYGTCFLLRMPCRNRS